MLTTLSISFSCTRKNPFSCKLHSKTSINYFILTIHNLYEFTVQIKMGTVTQAKIKIKARVEFCYEEHV